MPLPEDYQTAFKMDFLTYDGDPSDPPGPSNDWSFIGKDTWDGSVFFFGTPLTREQMRKLGMIYPAAGVEVPPPELRIVLRNPAPNPVRDAARLTYLLPADLPVRLAIFDVGGREVRELVRGWESAGEHRSLWKTSGVPAGVYFCRLRAGGISTTRRIVVRR